MTSDIRPSNQAPSVGVKYGLQTITAEILAAEERIQGLQDQIAKSEDVIERETRRTAETAGHISDINDLRDAWINQMLYTTGVKPRPEPDEGDDVK